MDKHSLNLKELTLELAQFAREREWEKFHSPKNLAMALGVESAELMEHFQWLTEEESRAITDPKKKQAVAHEMADIFVYMMRIVDLMGIDFKASLYEKMKLNAEKYPADLVKGSAKKYSEY